MARGELPAETLPDDLIVQTVDTILASARHAVAVTREFVFFSSGGIRARPWRRSSLRPRWSSTGSAPSPAPGIFSGTSVDLNVSAGLFITRWSGWGTDPDTGKSLDGTVATDTTGFTAGAAVSPHAEGGSIV